MGLGYEVNKIHELIEQEKERGENRLSRSLETAYSGPIQSCIIFSSVSNGFENPRERGGERKGDW